MRLNRIIVKLTPVQNRMGVLLSAHGDNPDCDNCMFYVRCNKDLDAWPRSCSADSASLLVCIVKMAWFA